ncbi:MAG: hypothetical protein PUD93_00605, partial [Lachnospiraceae bacterium]|nr:hypothetical protein [Lachnospiraceae bacterium]
YLSKILSSSNHLLSLINDILDMSRIESGKIKLEEKEANLSDIFHDIKSLAMGWIFPGYDTVDDKLPEKTTLQRELKKYLLAGNKFGTARGHIKLHINNTDIELFC